MCCAGSRFWAEFAHHLATQLPGTPFVPSDPTDVAASTAAIVAALAVIDLPWEGAAIRNSAAGSNSSSKGRVKASSVGCSRSYKGATLTLTAKAPCLLWVKIMKPLVAISPETVAVGAAVAASPAAAAGGSVGGDSAAAEGQEWVTVTGAGSSTAGAVTATTVAPGTGTPGASVANTVLVVDRLYDPRFASSTDPETGEEVLLALQPSEQQPLLTGQRYCRSVVVTSTVAAERDLQLLVQVRAHKHDSLCHCHYQCLLHAFLGMLVSERVCDAPRLDTWTSYTYQMAKKLGFHSAVHCCSCRKVPWLWMVLWAPLAGTSSFHPTHPCKSSRPSTSHSPACTSRHLLLSSRSPAGMANIHPHTSAWLLNAQSGWSQCGGLFTNSVHC